MQLNVFKVVTFNKYTDMIPHGDSSNLSPCNNDPSEVITPVIFVINFINQLGWVEVMKED